MNNAVIAGIFTLIAGIFTLTGLITGAAATVIIQLLLRKEKFKEILYKEKFAEYKVISCRVRALYYAALECLIAGKEHNHAVSNALDFIHYIRSKWFLIPEALDNECFELFRFVSVEMRKSSGESEVKRERLKDIYLSIANTMRDDLRIELLSKEIKKTLDFMTIKLIQADDNKADY
ncbi:MAG: hypothetical protein ACE5IH_08500 [Thermodesulfobacteriota bacterium]